MIERTSKPIVELSRPTVNFFQYTSLFGFGSGSKKFSRHNEKNLAPLFGKTRATIGAFLVRISKTAGCAPSDNGDVLTPPFHSLRQQTSTTSPHIALASD
ncbi:hypothetical protein [Porphyromonas gingivalis]|uniref:hypothetical protein n=1 Tax=Porphyromonas gingivalis TaxID=837 RepID=UPI003F883AC8